MTHPSPEALARLATEPASPEEAQHLAACAECRAEVDALRAQVAALGRLAPHRAPDLLWPRIAQSLRAEGLIAREAPGRFSWRARVGALAAALTLFAAGVAAGSAWTARRHGMSVVVSATPSAVGTAPPQDTASAAIAARLAAVETVLLTTREASRRGAADPVLERYHAALLGERAVLLRRVRLVSDRRWY